MIEYKKRYEISDRYLDIQPFKETPSGAEKRLEGMTPPPAAPAEPLPETEIAVEQMTPADEPPVQHQQENQWQTPTETPEEPLLETEIAVEQMAPAEEPPAQDQQENQGQAPAKILEETD